VEANQDNYQKEKASDQEYRNNKAGVKRNLAYDFERIFILKTKEDRSSIRLALFWSI
jgi:hypothetical protein